MMAGVKKRDRTEDISERSHLILGRLRQFGRDYRKKMWRACLASGTWSLVILC
jgi:hypothetical protein